MSVQTVFCSYRFLIYRLTPWVEKNYTYINHVKIFPGHLLKQHNMVIYILLSILSHLGFESRGRCYANTPVFCIRYVGIVDSGRSGVLKEPSYTGKTMKVVVK